MKDKIKQIIIEWLGGAYDAENKHFFNPDYYNDDQVTELAQAITEYLRKPLFPKCYCGKLIDLDNCVIWTRDDVQEYFCSGECFR